MQNLEIFPTEELKEEKFNPYDSRWNNIKKEIYHFFMTKLVEEVQRQAPINELYKLPDIHEIRKYGREYWVDFTKLQNHRQWCYRVACEFDYKEKKRIMKFQSFESWMDWKKMNMQEARDNILSYIVENLRYTPDKDFLKFFLFEMTDKILFYEDDYEGRSIKVDRKYSDCSPSPTK